MAGLQLRDWMYCAMAVFVICACEPVPEKRGAQIAEKGMASGAAAQHAKRPTGKPEVLHADWGLHLWRHPKSQKSGMTHPEEWQVDWEAHAADLELVPAVPVLSTKPATQPAIANTHLEIGFRINWHELAPAADRLAGWDARVDADMAAGPMVDDARGWTHPAGQALDANTGAVANKVEPLPSLSGFGFDDIYGEKDASIIGYTLSPGIGLAVLSNGGLGLSQSFWMAPRLKVVGYYGHGVEGNVQQTLSTVGVGTTMGARDHVVGFRLSYEF